MKRTAFGLTLYCMVGCQAVQNAFIEKKAYHRFRQCPVSRVGESYYTKENYADVVRVIHSLEQGKYSLEQRQGKYLIAGQFANAGIEEKCSQIDLDRDRVLDETELNKAWARVILSIVDIRNVRWDLKCMGDKFFLQGTNP